MVTWAPRALERGRGKIAQGHLEEREKRKEARIVKVSGRASDGRLVPPPALQGEFKAPRSRPASRVCLGLSHDFASSLRPRQISR